MTSKKTYRLFIPLLIGTACLFLLDLVIGSIRIPFSEIINIFTGNNADTIHTEILLNFRVPKAISAILAGASLSVAGLLMQTLFRNPLADPYILGVSSGASLGVAITMMSASLLPAFWINSGWGIIASAIIGAALVLLLVIGVSYKLQNAVSLLIVGIMFGTIASSIVSILQNFSNPDAIKLYVLWTFGSLSAVSRENLQILIPIISVGLLLAFYLHKKSDGLLLGENYAKGLGINIRSTRILMVLATGILAGSITAFTGPIAFVGVAVPHIARGIFKTSVHKILIPASVLIGASLILICDIITQIPTYTLPINTVSALFGAPVIIWIILRRR
ncbi:MAG: iron ABC transporter permease [Paludibacter sp.]|nr:iron ABC transporter permease [Paludibacter sp.]MDD4199230.1 iron ABC transporter permease [Paludibacter sp.]MDD4428994.1 iron ABC transporter permease [Paludibacter sp.]